MFKKYAILKWTLTILLVLIIIFFSFVVWIKSLVPPKNVELEKVQPQELVYLTNDIPLSRGSVLLVVTSIGRLGNNDKSTGYELTELARAYYVFTANGFNVDIASTKGGEPPVVIDDEDMGKYDYAFLNDDNAQEKVKNSIPVKNINAENYKAIYFAGGKGAMFDFPENKYIQSLIKKMYQSNKVVGAVCHGPSALVNVTLDNGESLIRNKKVSGFTNEEELLLISDAETIFPFLLQDKLIAQGAKFEEGLMYLEKVSHDKNLITGQNPWSTWAVVETMVEQLGYEPKYRKITDEENAVNILLMYEKKGKKEAKDLIKNLIKNKKQPVSRLLIAKHGVVSAMKGEFKRFSDIISLASYTKELTE